MNQGVWKPRAQLSKSLSGGRGSDLFVCLSAFLLIEENRITEMRRDKADESRMQDTSFPNYLKCNNLWSVKALRQVYEARYIAERARLMIWSNMESRSSAWTLDFISPWLSCALYLVVASNMEWTWVCEKKVFNIYQPELKYISILVQQGSLGKQPKFAKSWMSEDKFGTFICNCRRT